MAEGGSNNPYSFQSFIQQQEEGTTENRIKTGGEEVADIFDLPDVPQCISKKHADSDASDFKVRSQSEKKEKNPFSFKKFLAGGGARPKIKDGPDVAYGLPDFITGTINGEHSPRSSSSVPVNLPDFAIHASPDIQLASKSFDSLSTKQKSPSTFTGDSQSSLPHNRGSENHPARQTNGHCDTNVTNCIDDNEWSIPPLLFDPKTEERTLRPHRPLVSSLPDFLSDTTVLCNDKSTLLHSPDLTDIEQLRQVNEDLKTMLRESQEENHCLSQRLSLKCKELADLKVHETEETKALEQMVQQVEGNLATTTKRAIQAESTVAKLNQEIRALQNELSVITIENEDLRCGNTTIRAIKERSDYASTTLRKAATTAEQQLRDLLSGVDSLKLLADVLGSIDKVCDSSSIPSTSPEGAVGGEL